MPAWVICTPPVAAAAAAKCLQGAEHARRHEQLTVPLSLLAPPPHPSHPQGKRLLRLWFARPIVNLAVLEDRLDGVQFFLERPDAVQNLR